MSIFGSKIREELTQALADHLWVESRKRFLHAIEVNDGAAPIIDDHWLTMAQDAMDFIYGEEPDETPEAEDYVPADRPKCADCPDAGNDRRCDSHCRPGDRNTLTGVVNPPTNPLALAHPTPACPCGDVHQ